MAVLYILYIAAFLLMVLIQFSRQMSFSRLVGNFVVSGRLRESAPSGVPDEYPINEYAKVSFGGIEFILSNDVNNPLFLVDEDGSKAPLTVDTLTVSNDRAHFLLSDGAELVFYTQESADTNGLLISGILPERAASLQLPYLPSAFAKISVNDSGWQTVNADNVTYTFDRQPASGVDRYLILRRDDPMIFYHTEPKTLAFNPATFIVRGGIEKTVYDEQLKLWVDKVYAVWEKSVPLTRDELLVSVYLAEAARRGTYQSARSMMLQSFRNVPEQTYLSAPFIGRLDVALRTLSAAANAQSAQLPELLRKESPLLLGQDALGRRMLPTGRDLLKAQGAYADSLTVSAFTLEEVAALFEGYNNWPIYFPHSENPFERLVPRAFELTTGGLIKDEIAGNVFVADGTRVDIEFNLRLGVALAAYGDKNGTSSWVGIGRSLVLSALALTDDAGQLPASLTVNNAGEIIADETDETGTTEKIQAAQIYPILTLAVYYPHPVDLTAVQDGLWVWTASPETKTVFQNNVLDMSVSFPIGWAHHLLIRGVNRFSKIQLRDMDYRSDPRFEEYNSPGWVYSASEKTLLVKMVHRYEEEHIRIFY
ncbi:MAG: hypothetical protein LBT00_06125 [Spirochaetaceae bacterium]|jgi:hypothetical protein|nr:hypothetical protein [Spirochaetaceae bacterium]